MSIAEWRKLARPRLAAVSETTSLDADLLLMHTLQLTRSTLLSTPERVIDPADIGRLDDALRQRCDDVPLAYITGSQPFWSLDLDVTRATLVPRADTEVLVEQALRRIPSGHPSRVADLGTGSGAVALAIASERPHSMITACDRSHDALTVAVANARKHGIRNVSFCVSDWFNALPTREFDVIVSNPPYVESDYAELERSLRHEPAQALASGRDGLDAIRQIAGQAADYLSAGGWLLLEHGNKQANAVSGILRASDFTQISLLRDLAGNPRVTEAQYNR